MSNVYDSLIQHYADIHSVRWTLFKALIQHESNFNPNAVGDNGVARGLCQMHPGAAHDVGAVWEDLFDPEKAIAAGAAYLGNQLKHFQTEEQALVAYNQGPGVATNGIRDGRYKQGLKYASAVWAIERTYVGEQTGAGAGSPDPAVHLGASV